MQRTRPQTTSEAETIHASYHAVLQALEEDARSVDDTLKEGLEHLKNMERMSRETLALTRSAYDHALASHALNLYVVKVLKRRLKAADRKRWFLHRTGNRLVRVARGRPNWSHAVGAAAAGAAAIVMGFLVF